MAKSKHEDPAALRQLLARNERARQHQLRILLATRRRLLRGSYVVLGKRCGKPGCACTRGELHQARYLSSSQEGKTRMVYVAASEAGGVRAAAERYQRFRRARAVVVKLSARTLELADRLQGALTDALPAAAERRRRRRGGCKQEGGDGGGVGGVSGGKRR